MTAAKRAPVTAYLGLGANLGDAQAAVRLGLARIAALPGTRLLQASSLYRSAPVGASGPDFINAVVAVETGLSAPDLLRAVQGIEQQAGRERPYRNAPRTLDIDVLCYGSARIASDALTVPHPRMQERAFVLKALAEIAPECVTAADLHAVRDQVCEKI